MSADEKNIGIKRKNRLKDFFTWISLLSIVGFSIFSQISLKEELLYPWISFVVQVPLSLLMSFLTFNFLDYIFIPILYKDYDYKTHNLTLKDKVQYYVFAFLFFSTLIFLLFVTVLYILNFQKPSGIYYLQLIQAMLFFCTVFYFLMDGSDDFSGHAYCDRLMRLNQKEKITFHWLPRTLTKEMLELNAMEPFSGF